MPPKIVNDASVIHIFCVTCQLIFRCDKECTNGAHFWANSPLIFVCRASDKNTQKKRQLTEKKKLRKPWERSYFYSCDELTWEWRAYGAVIGALLSPGLDSQIARLGSCRVDCLIGSCPCITGFSRGSPVFFPPQLLTLQFRTLYLSSTHNETWMSFIFAIRAFEIYCFVMFLRR